MGTSTLRLEVLSRRGALRRLSLAAASCITPTVIAQKVETAATGDGVLRFGQSAPVSGEAQHLGIEYQRGIALAFQEANARGGVYGQKLELLSYDDGYEVDLAQSNTVDLIESERVFALIGYVGTAMAERCLPLAVAARIPFVAPLCGADSLRTPNQAAQLVLLRASHAAEAQLIVDTVRTMGWTHFAAVVQEDADGLSCERALTASLKAAGLAPATALRVERNFTGSSALKQKDIVQVSAKLLESQPQAVFLLCAHGTASAFIRECRRRGYAGGLYGTSLAAAGALGETLGPIGAGVSVTQVVPPITDVSRAAVAAYARALKSLPNARPDPVSLEGWLAGLLVVEGLRRCDGNATRVRFMAALTNLGTWDPGGFPIELSGNRRQASNLVLMSMLDRQGRVRI